MQERENLHSNTDKLLMTGQKTGNLARLSIRLFCCSIRLYWSLGIVSIQHQRLEFIFGLAAIQGCRLVKESRGNLCTQPYLILCSDERITWSSPKSNITFSSTPLEMKSSFNKRMASISDPSAVFFLCRWCFWRTVYAFCYWKIVLHYLLHTHTYH